MPFGVLKDVGRRANEAPRAGAEPGRGAVPDKVVGRVLMRWVFM